MEKYKDEDTIETRKEKDKLILNEIASSWSLLLLLWSQRLDYKNYSSKREDLEEEDQREDERNVIL